MVFHPVGAGSKAAFWQNQERWSASWQLKGSTMYGKFQMRMLGQAEFKSYLEWSGMKK
jgi:hypothetical protein